MVFKKAVSLLLAGILSILLCSSLLWAADEEFSADIVTTSPQGSFTSKMYNKKNKQRMESEVQGQQSTSIIRMDKKVIWVIMHDQKMYMEMPLKEEVTSLLHDPNVKMERKFLGNEKVEGHPAKKYFVTVTSSGQKSSGYLWEATDLNKFPIKWQSEDKTVTTVWKNIKFGHLPDNLFEVPAGYEKFQMPGGY